jgi:hypothetical protein
MLFNIKVYNLLRFNCFTFLPNYSSLIIMVVIFVRENNVII